jgi:predicted small metal-binding protein
MDNFLYTPRSRCRMSLISLIDRAWLGSCSKLKSRMSKELRCEDVFAGCAYVSVGSDIRALMTEYMAHVRDVHRVTSPPPELRILAMVAVRERLPQID